MKTITVDKLTEEQMKKVREFLKSPPNKYHTGKKGELYGHYITISVDVKATADRHTGVTTI